MPKIQPRSATPPTPRQPEDLLRRSSLYGANLKAPFIHKKLCEEVVDDLLVRSSERGIALASSVPAGQQMAERDSGFVRRAKVSVGPERAFYTGTSTTVYSTEPKNLLRFGRSGAKQLQRGRLRGHLRNQEWTPKLLATPVAHSGPISMCSPALWPDEAQYTTGSSVYKKKLAKEHAHPAWCVRHHVPFVNHSFTFITSYHLYLHHHHHYHRRRHLALSGSHEKPPPARPSWRRSPR